MFDLSSILVPGMHSVAQKLLDQSDTAAHYGSGTLGHLIATPAIVALMIEAATNSIEDRLPDGFVSVGHRLEITHEVPTCIGMTLRAKATLKKIDGNRLIFEIICCDECGDVGYGIHERAVVHKATLFESANQRLPMLSLR